LIETFNYVKLWIFCVSEWFRKFNVKIYDLKHVGLMSYLET